MCGAYGAVGFGWNGGTIRALTLANRERGTDSLGFFDSSGRMIKAGVDPDEALAQDNISRWLNVSERGDEKRPASWFIAGHTRQATRGKVNRQNSHPFRYGKIIGSHNGMVNAPNGYAVDSQYLFDSLNKANGDYNTAWSSISGYWGITWYDGQSFYLQVHGGELSIGLSSDGCWYYSSSKAHLAACIGYNVNIRTLGDGETIRFTLKDGVVVMEEDDKFVSTTIGYHTRKYNYTQATDWEEYYKSSNGTHRIYAHYDNSSPVRDYDAGWRDAWEEYLTPSEHSRTE